MTKKKMASRLAKPKFAMTGVMAGAGAGMIIGLVVELAGHRSMGVMQAGGIAGIAIAVLAESVRF